ncbi:MAG: nitroreductase [Alcaligenaceae bacterium]|nr:nitroreductase [Alcaligenaceae bacterium]
MINSSQSLDDLVRRRKSVRQFKNKVVDEDLLRRALEVARYTPSASNTQPWEIWVVSGETRVAVQQVVCDMFEKKQYDEVLAEKYPDLPAGYYPEEWMSPYRDRRVQNGKEFYGILDIPKGDDVKIRAQMRRNFEFFDAPVGVFVTTHKSHLVGADLDVAMWVYAFTLGLKAYGLDSCIQAAWLPYQDVIAPVVGIPEDHRLVLGISVGYEDASAPINTMMPLRVSQEDNVHWKD